MASINRKTKFKKISPQKGPGATEHVLEWICNLIHNKKLGPNDPLPRELEITCATRTGRSSVREALTTLKVLGIIATRRKTGIRIVRDPVLLGLRAYFTDRYASKTQFIDAMRFRSAMEWGMADMIFSQITRKEVAYLRGIVEDVRNAPEGRADLTKAEKQFHTQLTAASANHFARLIGHLYAPLFDTWEALGGKHEAVKEWLAAHELLVRALEKRNKKNFLKHMQKHVGRYYKAF